VQAITCVISQYVENSSIVYILEFLRLCEGSQQTHYFHCDQIGIPREMIDKDGNLVWLRDYYEPEAGRFVNHNPIKYLGGTNFYTYAFSIVNWVDFLGLNPFRVFGKVTIIV